MNNRILVVDDFHNCLIEGLLQHGCEVFYRPEIKTSQVFGAMQEIQPSGLLVRSKLHLDAEILAANQAWLKWIGRGGAGMDNIDEQAALDLGITCFNAGEANSIAVGEQTLGMLLGLLHNIGKGNLEVRQGKWDREGNRGVELASLTVGIIGFGNTGSAVGKRLKSFGCKILAFDKYKSGYGEKLFSTLAGKVDLEALGAIENGVIYETQMGDIFAHADVISLHVPLTEETHKWLNRSSLEKFKKPIWLLNLSRGMVVDLQTVLEGLESGKILGFGADVLEKEPPFENLPVFEILRKNDGVIFTPHIGGWTVESYRRISEVLLKKIQTLIL